MDTAQMSAKEKKELVKTLRLEGFTNDEICVVTDISIWDIRKYARELLAAGEIPYFKPFRKQPQKSMESLIEASRKLRTDLESAVNYSTSCAKQSTIPTKVDTPMPIEESKMKCPSCQMVRLQI